MTIDRRKFLGIGAAFSIASIGSTKELLRTSPATPPEIEGPFYPQVEQADKDFDLTVIKGHKDSAKGEVVYISGQVVDTSGNPIRDAIVDIWQANSFGRYNHPIDTSKAQVDENFQGWAIVPSGKEGKFRFKTILPGMYQVTEDWKRPPHIHYKVTKPGYIELITQMYFPDEPLNKIDKLILRKKPEERAMMISTLEDKSSKGERIFSYKIILEKV